MHDRTLKIHLDGAIQIGERSVPSLKLLVVEDDLECLELMTEVFTSLKAEVRPLSDSQEAAALLDHEKFDGIFLDVEMPKLDGLQLARRIRQSSWNKSTPIVIVTGRDERDTMGQCFDIGVNFFLQKPIDRQKLNRLFRTVRGPILENRRRHVRIPLQTEITCTVGSKILKGRTWNVGRGGIQVEVDFLRPGDKVRLSLTLPKSGVVVDTFGEVIWAKEKRQGIGFTKMSEENQQRVQSFIEEIESLQR
jgi:CheY-like chemotaxis protein